VKKSGQNAVMVNKEKYIKGKDDENV